MHPLGSGTHWIIFPPSFKMVCIVHLSMKNFAHLEPQKHSLTSFPSIILKEYANSISSLWFLFSHFLCFSFVASQAEKSIGFYLVPAIQRAQDSERMLGLPSSCDVRDTISCRWGLGCVPPFFFHRSIPRISIHQGWHFRAWGGGALAQLCFSLTCVVRWLHSEMHCSNA